jgi:hypothetical protein
MARIIAATVKLVNTEAMIVAIALNISFSISQLSFFTI